MNQPDIAKPKPNPLNIFKWALHWQILIGLIFGALIGYLTAKHYIHVWQSGIHTAGPVTEGGEGAELVTREVMELNEVVKHGLVYLVYELIGDIFLNGLKLVVIPLVTSSIICSIIGIGERAGFRRIGLKTLAYYAATSLLSILTGLTLVNLLKPGLLKEGVLLTSENVKQFSDVGAAMSEKVGTSGAADFLDVFRQLIPANIVEAASSNNLLGLIVVSLFVGYLIARIKPEPGQVLKLFFDGLYRVSIRLTNIILRFAPIGVLFLIAATVTENYARLSQEERLVQFLGSLILFAGTVVVALAAHMLIILPLIIWAFTRVNPYRHIRAMAPALLTAFSTASSSATLPVTMECAEQRAGVSRKTASFVLPLGATVNMDGTALYECVAAIFIVQAFGWQLDIAQQFFIVLIALLTSIGVAGVPSASLVAIIVILTAIQGQLETQGVNIPLVAGFPILLIFDRPLDMCRTAVNIFSDSVGSVIVAKTEGEEGILAPELLTGNEEFAED